MVKTKKYDLVGNIMRYESGESKPKEVKQLFQKLENSGMAYTLQGHYGRTAQAMIRQGFIKPRKRK